MRGLFVTKGFVWNSLVRYILGGLAHAALKRAAFGTFAPARHVFRVYAIPSMVATHGAGVSARLALSVFA
jgi:hypothetical protein